MTKFGLSPIFTIEALVRVRDCFILSQIARPAPGRGDINHVSDLRRCFTANIISETFKFGERLAFEFVERFLMWKISHDVHRLKSFCLLNHAPRGRFVLDQEGRDSERRPHPATPAGAAGAALILDGKRPLTAEHGGSRLRDDARASDGGF